MEILIENIIDPLLNTIQNPYDAAVIKDFAESIVQVGLLHPITVMPLNNGKYQLVTGGKRLAALKLLGNEFIPVILVEPGLNEDGIEEISLIENLKRDNKSWYEEAELTAKLHNLRVRQKGQATEARKDLIPKEKKGWSQRDSARELGVSLGYVNESILLNNAIESNPNLKKVKDRTTALKLIRSVVSRERAAEEAQMPAEFSMNQVFLGDSLEILKAIPNDTFDVCLTDPPWITYYRDETLIRDESTIDVFREVFRVLKPNSFLYAVMSTTDLPDYGPRLEQFGFRVQKYPLLWAKSGTITHGRRVWEYARDYEPILLAVKGNPSLTSPTEMSSILSHPAIHNSRLSHPHEKPVSLLREILQQCSYPGSKVLDPFAGSGSTLEAAREINREYIGIERDKERYEKIIRRLAK